MKKFVKFSLYHGGTGKNAVRGVCGDGLRASEMEHLKKHWPQFFPPDLVGFHLRAELGDPVIDEVISYLRTTSREPHWERRPGLPWEHPTLYQIQGERVWEQSDFDKASYFRWLVDVQAGKGKKLPPDGRFEVEFYRNKQIGIMVNGWNPFCTSEYRKELEAQNFVGLSFRPVKVSFRTRDKNYALWQVWSTITLPPVLNEVSTDEEPFNAAKTTGCGVNDIYFPPYYRFPAAKLEPFDIALTTERWGGGFLHYREPAIIVSRRFRDWFMTQNVEVGWWPVALE
ncbi:MAG: hypothetical protein U1F71_06990 [Verrucomicrobiaceae bacterium]